MANFKNEYICLPDHIELIINSQKYGKHSFIIDVENLDKVQKYNWSIANRKSVNGYYAQARIDGMLVLLHRYLTGFPEGKVVDHLDRNTFNNKVSNLRICTRGDNAKNRAGYGSCNYKYLSSHTRYDRKSPRTLYTVAFPDCKKKQKANINEAYAYYVECLMNTKEVL